MDSRVYDLKGNTPDATVKTLLNIPWPGPGAGVMHVEGYVTATLADGSKGVSFGVRSHVAFDGSGNPVGGSQQTAGANTLPGDGGTAQGFAPPGVTFTASQGNVAVKVTGLAGSSINWRGRLKVVRNDGT